LAPGGELLTALAGGAETAPQLFDAGKHGLGVSLSHLRANGLGGGLCGRGRHLGRRKVMAGAGLVVEHHFLRVLCHQSRCVMGKITRDCDDHVVFAVGQALLSLGFGRDRYKFHRRGFFQIGGETLAGGQAFTLVGHGLILIDDGHGEVGEPAVGVPHGLEKRDGVD